jgi:hypothetical protein
MSLEVDYMEYADDEAARAAYVSDGGGSQYPPAQSATYVKATSYLNTSYLPHFATDPAKSLTGSHVNNCWLSAASAVANQRFHIDLGEAKIINKILYHNAHNSGGNTNRGVQNFTFWGSNDAGDFADLTYSHDGTWVQLTTSQSTLDEHVALDQADPKYITVTNDTAYRYYAFKFADTWGATDYMSVRRIELQIDSLNAFSEASIKVQGSYALKGVASQASSLNKSLTRTVSPVIDLTDKTIIKFDIRASRIGSNLKLGIHDSGGITTEITPNILSADAYQYVVWDLSAVVNADKDAIDQIKITIVNADAENTFYLDNLFADIIEQLLIHRGRDRFRTRGYSLG